MRYILIIFLLCTISISHLLPTVSLAQGLATSSPPKPLIIAPAVGGTSNFSALGQVLAVHQPATIVLIRSNGSSIEVTADTARVIKNGKKNATLADIFPGDHAAITGKIVPDGSYLAQYITIGKAPAIKKSTAKKTKKPKPLAVKKKSAPIIKKK